MNFTVEQARTQSATPEELLGRVFPNAVAQVSDAVFLAADRATALGFAGLPYAAPICNYLMCDSQVAAYLAANSGSHLLWLEGDVLHDLSSDGEKTVTGTLANAVIAIRDRILASPGSLNEKGELTLDLKAYAVGPHYPVNLLLGNRAGYDYPLITTPKSALDGLGRGSFRAKGGEQVLATRCVIDLSQNGEPANRQFYLVEGGKQVFYSADVHTNVKAATCTHSQGRSTIEYTTECGLSIKRTIFILPQEDGMPSAVEAQRVEVTNLTDRPRDLAIVFTGMFGIADPGTVANDVVFANVVVESELYYDQEGRPAALAVHENPSERGGQKRFAALLCEGEGMDAFCASLPDFVGRGTLDRPELVGHLPNQLQRKNTPFFAMQKGFAVKPGETATIDEFVGMHEVEGEVGPAFDGALFRLLATYADPEALTATLARVVDFWNAYPAYIQPATGDARFDAYVGHNLPFQVLYQTYVSRAFAWTQKSYREIGFREIQDNYASMYYLAAMGQGPLVKELLSNWVRNVWRMGYAFHDFTVAGKEPGDCSDDSLWLVQAVYRYVKLTGDKGFLTTEYPIAGEDGATRTLWDTIVAILTYSGKISVGKHGLPLLDKADWNDTLRLDNLVLKGPQKEELYRQQLAEKGQEYGVAWENDLSESVMNACLLKIAADEAAELGALIGKDEGVAFAAQISADVAQSMQANAWKGDYFARCLVNDGRGVEYLGATGDGLALDPAMPGTYFLNSYSWSILAGVATEDQIRAMLGVVGRYLKTGAGLKLCTLVAFDRLGLNTPTGLYFAGDRENGGVFKHAAMMATVASLKAAKSVADEALARDLADLAFFMVDKTLPYRAMDDPFVLKGNPRFCTQYNNSETGENIGPMLSGTASWLTLAVFEAFGIEVGEGSLGICPVLRSGTDSLDYALKVDGTSVDVHIEGGDGRFRASASTRYSLDGQPSTSVVDLPKDGRSHQILVQL